MGQGFGTWRRLFAWTSFRCWMEESFFQPRPSVQGCTRKVKFSGTFCLTICVASEAFGCITPFLSLPSLV